MRHRPSLARPLLVLCLAGGCAAAPGPVTPPAAPPTAPAPPRTVVETRVEVVEKQVPVLSTVERIIEIERPVPGDRPVDAAVVAIVAAEDAFAYLDPAGERFGPLAFLLDRATSRAGVALVSADPSVGVVRSLGARDPDLGTGLAEIRASGARSDLDTALDQALNELTVNGHQEGTILVLAGDAEDIDAPTPFLRPGIRVHVIARPGGDEPSQLYFLSEMSGGRYYPLVDGTELAETLAETLALLAHEEQLLTATALGGTLTREIPVDRSVSNLTLTVAYRGTLSGLALSRPDGVRVVESPAARVAGAPEILAFSIHQPPPGAWQVEVEAEDAWIQISGRTDLRLTPPGWLPVLPRARTTVPILFVDGNDSFPPDSLGFVLTSGRRVLSSRSLASGRGGNPVLPETIWADRAIHCMRVRGVHRSPTDGQVVRREVSRCGFAALEPAPVAAVEIPPSLELPTADAAFLLNLQGNLQLDRGETSGLLPGMHCLVLPSSGAAPVYEGYLSKVEGASSFCTVTSASGSAPRLSRLRTRILVKDLALDPSTAP